MSSCIRALRTWPLRMMKGDPRRGVEHMERFAALRHLAESLGGGPGGGPGWGGGPRPSAAAADVGGAATSGPRCCCCSPRSPATATS